MKKRELIEERKERLDIYFQVESRLACLALGRGTTRAGSDPTIRHTGVRAPQKLVNTTQFQCDELYAFLDNPDPSSSAHHPGSVSVS